MKKLLLSLLFVFSFSSMFATISFDDDVGTDKIENVVKISDANVVSFDVISQNQYVSTSVVLSDENVCESGSSKIVITKQRIDIDVPDSFYRRINYLKPLIKNSHRFARDGLSCKNLLSLNRDK